MLPFLALIFVAGSLLYYYGTRNYNYWKKRNVPHPRPLPFFGNTINATLMRRSAFDVVDHIYNEYRDLPYVGLYELGKPALLIRDPNLLKYVLIKDFSHFQGRGIAYNEDIDPLAAHLITINGKRWRQLRTKLTPAFSTGKMRNIFGIMAKSSEKFKEYMKKYADAEATAEFRDLAAKYTSEVIGACCFGLDPNTMQDEDSEFRTYCRKVLDPTVIIAAKRLIRMYLPRVFKYFSLTLNPTDVIKFFTTLIKDMITYREVNNVSRQDFLQILIDLKNSQNLNKDTETEKDAKDRKSGSRDETLGASDIIITDNDIMAQSYVFLLAGTETSYSTISFALYELAANPDIQDKLRDEVRITTNKHGSITYDAISEMHLLHRVVRETLRKYAPTGFVPRLCNEDYKLPGTDLVIEKGVRVLVPIKSIHYDPLYYYEPNKFDPDRFLHPKNDCTYLPFGGGPRICIGSRFAYAQIKACMATLLADYEFILPPNMKEPLEYFVTSNTLNPKSGIWLTIRHYQEALTRAQHANGNMHGNDNF